jgi:hypothetical protein
VSCQRRATCEWTRCSLDALLKVVDGGGARVLILEVLDELRAHVIPGVNTVLGEGVEPLPCIAVHQQWQVACGQQLSVAGDSHRLEVRVDPDNWNLLGVILLDLPWSLEIWRVLLASDHWFEA